MGRLPRFLLWLPLILGLTAILSAACRSPQAETGEGTPEVTAVVPTPVIDRLTATPAATATAPAVPGTATPLPTTTPGSAGITIPDGWSLLTAGGITFLMPETWLDLTPLLLDGTIATQLGPNTRLFVVDEKTTSQQLLAGQALAEGAFALALARPVPNAGTPMSALTAMLAAAAAAPAPVQTLLIRGQQAAYVDVLGDPLGLLPQAPAALKMRLVVIASGVADTYLLLALGAAPENFADFDEIFSFIVQTTRITAPESLTAFDILPNAVLGDLVDGANVEGTLLSAGHDVWSFYGEAGQYATIRLTPVDSVDLSLALLDANGRPLALSDGGFAGDPEALLDRPLPRSGVYYLYVDEFFNQSGRYSLTFSLTDTPRYSAGGQILPGQVVQGTLQGSEENAWRFMAHAGQRVSIVLAPAGDQLDVVLRLVGPDGDRLLNLDEGFSGDAEIAANVLLPISGEYTIIIKDFSGRGGPYSLSLDEATGGLDNFYEAGDLISGALYQETLQPDEAHAWFFTGFAGDVIQLQVTPLTARLDLDLWLLSPELERLAMQDLNLAGAGEVINLTLPEDGQYVVLVQDYYGDGGTYQIGLTVLENNRLQVGGDLLYHFPVTRTLAVNQTALWYLAVFPEDEVTITLSPLSPETDLVLYLKDETGRTILTVDNAGPGEPETIVDYVPVARGIWLVMIEEYLGRGGAYRLEVTRPLR